MSGSHILKLRDFRNLWLAQTTSQIGDAFYYVTFMFMVKRVTGSDAMVGYVGAAEILPLVLFGPVAGVVADRIDRKSVLLWSDMVSGIWLVLLALAVIGIGYPPVWLIFASAFALSTARAFFLPAKNAAIPNLVDRERLVEATSFSMATESIVKLAGLGLSAAMLAVLYRLEGNSFFVAAAAINSLSFLGSAWFVARLHPILPDRTADTSTPHPLTDLLDGLRYLKRRAVLVTMLVMDMGVSLLIAPFFVMYVASNDEWFGGRPQTLTLFELAFFLGMIIGSSWVSRMEIKRPGTSWGISMAILGLSVAALAYSPIFWLYFFWNFVAGLAMPFGLIPMQTYMQLSVEDGFRGRVNSSMRTASTAMMPLGMILGGYILQKIGLVWAFLAMGIGLVLVAAGGLAVAVFRRAEMPVGAPSAAPEGAPA